MTPSATDIINEFIDSDKSISDYEFIPSNEIITENISKRDLYEGIEIINIIRKNQITDSKPTTYKTFYSLAS